MRKARFSLVVLCMLALSAATADPVAAQAPPPKPKPKSDEGGTSKSTNPAPAKASLLVTVDEACTVTVNGLVSRNVAAGQAVRIPLAELGEQLIEARSSDGGTVSDTVVVDKPGQKIVKLSLGRTLPRGALIWPRRDNGSDVDWHQSKAYCDGLSLAGYDDWRLPTIDELETLHDPSVTRINKVVSGIELTGCCPWSSSLDADATSSAWVFDFGFGERFSLGFHNGAQRGLCVRSSGG